MKRRILIVDDDPKFLDSLANVLNRHYSSIKAASLTEAKQSLSPRIDLALLDIRLNNSDPLNKEGIELLKYIKNGYPDLPVIMMTAYGDIDIAVEAMKLGASDFIQKGRLDIREFRKVIDNVLAKSRLERKVTELEEKLQKLEPWEIVGEDPKIMEIKKLIDIVARDGKTTVLIRGETGTGKELVARAIHQRGIRREGPFVPVSISTLSKTVVESELFGHERGAFTDAYRTKLGYIEKADGGVLFLDEIGDLDLDIQAKLLRFLEDKTFCRIGSTQPIKVDVQLVAATNKNLEEAIKKGTFRQDLYYRLKTIELFLPRLRERANDIPLLANYFLTLFRGQGRTKLRKISPSAMQLLKEYSWPGNIRELKSSIERAIIYTENNGHSQIEPDDLPYEVRVGKYEIEKSIEVNIPKEGTNIEEELARTELAYIERALKMTGGKKTEAWKLLGYNDRFALRRRVIKIMEDFPDLVHQFPLVREKYKEKDSTY